MASRERDGAGTHPWTVLFGPWSVGVAVLVVAGALAGAQLAEPGRLGFELCWTRRLSGLPCPGCGLTRSVCHLLRGDLAEALRFHPFGLLVLPFAVVAASSLVWPRGLVARARQGFERRRRSVERLYRWTLFAFLGYGVVRTLAVMAGLWPGWG